MKPSSSPLPSSIGPPPPPPPPSEEPTATDRLQQRQMVTEANAASPISRISWDVLERCVCAYSPSILPLWYLALSCTHFYSLLGRKIILSVHAPIFYVRPAVPPRAPTADPSAPCRSNYAHPQWQVPPAESLCICSCCQKYLSAAAMKREMPWLAAEGGGPLPVVVCCPGCAALAPPLDPVADVLSLFEKLHYTRFPSFASSNNIRPAPLTVSIGLFDTYYVSNGRRDVFPLAVQALTGCPSRGAVGGITHSRRGGAPRPYTMPRGCRGVGNRTIAAPSLSQQHNRGQMRSWASVEGQQCLRMISLRVTALLRAHIKTTSPMMDEEEERAFVAAQCQRDTALLTILFRIFFAFNDYFGRGQVDEARVVTTRLPSGATPAPQRCPHCDSADGEQVDDDAEVMGCHVIRKHCGDCGGKWVLKIGIDV